MRRKEKGEVRLKEGRMETGGERRRGRGKKENRKDI